MKKKRITHTHNTNTIHFKMIFDVIPFSNANANPFLSLRRNVLTHPTNTNAYLPYLVSYYIYSNHIHCFFFNFFFLKMMCKLLRAFGSTKRNWEISIHNAFLLLLDWIFYYTMNGSSIVSSSSMQCDDGGLDGCVCVWKERGREYTFLCYLM